MGCWWVAGWATCAWGARLAGRASGGRRGEHTRASAHAPRLTPPPTHTPLTLTRTSCSCTAGSFIEGWGHRVDGGDVDSAFAAAANDAGSVILEGETKMQGQARASGGVLLPLPLLRGLVPPCVCTSPPAPPAAARRPVAAPIASPPPPPPTHPCLPLCRSNSTWSPTPTSSSPRRMTNS